MSLTSPRVILPKTVLAKMAPTVPTAPTIIMKRPTMTSKIDSWVTFEEFATSK